MSNHIFKSYAKVKHFKKIFPKEMENHEMDARTEDSGCLDNY